MKDVEFGNVGTFRTVRVKDLRLPGKHIKSVVLEMLAALMVLVTKISC